MFVKSPFSVVGGGLEYDEPGSSGDANIMDSPEMQPHEGAAGTLEQHLQRVIGDLNTMHTI